MTMSQKVFIQVFIKSENDLPKEIGYYNVHLKHSRIELKLIQFPYKSPITNNYWLKRVDWYLQERELPTEDNASSKIVKSSLGKNSNDYYSGFMDCFDWLMSKLK